MFGQTMLPLRQPISIGTQWELTTMSRFTTITDSGQGRRFRSLWKVHCNPTRSALINSVLLVRAGYRCRSPRLAGTRGIRLMLKPTPCRNRAVYSDLDAGWYRLEASVLSSGGNNMSRMGLSNRQTQPISLMDELLINLIDNILSKREQGE